MSDIWDIIGLFSEFERRSKMRIKLNYSFRLFAYGKEERHPKWELVGTHTGRRTFIVNALSLGIPPNVVMKWTGHNDYKAMRPYIDIVDSIKAESMTKFNGLI